MVNRDNSLRGTVVALTIAALTFVALPVFWGPLILDLIKAQKHASCPSKILDQPQSEI